MSVVKINVLNVPESMREELERRFANRAGQVEAADGFEWFELLRPVEGTDDYLVYTRWRSEADFASWQQGRDFAHNHQGGGPKRPPASAGSQLWSFEVVTSAPPAAG